MKTRAVTVDCILEEREKCWVTEVGGVLTYIPKALSSRTSEFIFEIVSWLAKKIEAAAA